MHWHPGSMGAPLERTLLGRCVSLRCAHRLTVVTVPRPTTLPALATIRLSVPSVARHRWPAPVHAPRPGPELKLRLRVATLLRGAQAGSTGRPCPAEPESVVQVVASGVWHCVPTGATPAGDSGPSLRWQRLGGSWCRSGVHSGFAYVHTSRCTCVLCRVLSTRFESGFKTSLLVENLLNHRLGPHVPCENH
jgi:hypothetical protein